MDTQLIEKYLEVLQSELVPSLGCTEPAAIAYAGAVACQYLGFFPENIHVACSGNVVKNVKGVTVPHSGGEKGIEIAAVLGTICAKPELKLEILTSIDDADAARGRQLVAQGYCTVSLLRGVPDLHIVLTAQGQGHEVTVEIAGGHTNIVRLEKNGHILEGGPYIPGLETVDTSRDFMTVNGIIEFAENCPLDRVMDILDRQIDYNTHISEEGLSGHYGANVGRNLLKTRGNDIRTRAKAVAAAGSDARMSGCSLPVVINSGSGNQGMTVSLPVIEYAKELQTSKETLYRALVLSNLMAIHQKSGIGKLSAYCGAVSAACGSGAAITWLYGGNAAQISATITNTLANVSGIVCDGAKPSCAAKIATSVDAAILGHDLAMQSEEFHEGEGIVKDTVENTIHSVGRLARIGMRSTDEEVLHIMLENSSTPMA